MAGLRRGMPGAAGRAGGRRGTAGGRPGTAAGCPGRAARHLPGSRAGWDGGQVAVTGGCGGRGQGCPPGKPASARPARSQGSHACSAAWVGARSPGKGQGGRTLRSGRRLCRGLRLNRGAGGVLPSSRAFSVLPSEPAAQVGAGGGDLGTTQCSSARTGAACGQGLRSGGALNPEGSPGPRASSAHPPRSPAPGLAGAGGPSASRTAGAGHPAGCGGRLWPGELEPRTGAGPRNALPSCSSCSEGVGAPLPVCGWGGGHRAAAWPWKKKN